jgi:hypothetical protein
MGPDVGASPQWSYRTLHYQGCAILAVAKLFGELYAVTLLSITSTTPHYVIAIAPFSSIHLLIKTVVF